MECRAARSRELPSWDGEHRFHHLHRYGHCRDELGRRAQAEKGEGRTSRFIRAALSRHGPIMLFSGSTDPKPKGSAITSTRICRSSSTLSYISTGRELYDRSILYRAGHTKTLRKRILKACRTRRIDERNLQTRADRTERPDQRPGGAGAAGYAGRPEPLPGHRPAGRTIPKS